MALYRFYRLDGAGRIGFGEWLEAEDDREALAKARELSEGGLKCEVWEGRRLVGSLSSERLRPKQPLTLLRELRP